MRTSTTRKQARHEYWAEQISAQGQSGLTVKRFCQQHGFSEHSFYAWRKRLRNQKPGLRFALVEPVPRTPAAAVELVLASGERLLIGPDVDASVLRAVLEALRA
jgi:transposase-like protein